MTDNNSAVEKSIVNELNFSAKTAKRAGWELFEFAVESPHLVRVTNASYGFEKDDHSYLVGVEDRDGLLIPAECECKADKYTGSTIASTRSHSLQSAVRSFYKLLLSVQPPPR